MRADAAAANYPVEIDLCSSLSEAALLLAFDWSWALPAAHVKTT